MIGNEVEAIEIAARLRVLLHTTRSQTSLLDQMHVTPELLFASTATPYYGKNIIPYMGLSVITFRVDKESKYTCPEEYDKFKYLTFADWWNEIIIDDKKNVFSRRDIVLNIADTDGGTHVDGKLYQDYDNLTHHNSIGFSLETPFPSVPTQPTNNIAYQSIRVIAQEFIISYDFYLQKIRGSRLVDEKEEKKLKAIVYMWKEKVIYFCDIRSHFNDFFLIASINRSSGNLSGGKYDNRYCKKRRYLSSAHEMISLLYFTP